MSRATSSFKQSDVMRAIKGARAAGWKVTGIKVVNGAAILVADNGDHHIVAAGETSNEWDEVLRGQKS